ncbi:type I-E CRISPR-associated protein Cas7/Cse4/CasC, partial [Streptomyces rochei]
GLASESVVRLADELQAVGETWGDKPLRTLATYTAEGDKITEVFGSSLPFPALLDSVDALVGQWLADGEIAPAETTKAGAR